MEQKKNLLEHIPVLCHEVLHYLDPHPGEIVLDGTLGLGGHAQQILEKMERKGKYIGLDQDARALERVRQYMQPYLHDGCLEIVQANVRSFSQVLDAKGIRRVHKVLLDLGISSLQVDDPQRGFSFLREGPLDMRMDISSLMDARQVVNTFSLNELEKIIRIYGEERHAKKIAEAIVTQRKLKPYKTTKDLVQTIESQMHMHHRPNIIHPATRTFQALRIYVNDELGALEETLATLPSRVEPEGRIVVISFHSLEDRIVKYALRTMKQQGLGEILTKKPVVPSEEEKRRNPRSRSAKLRAIKILE